MYALPLIMLLFAGCADQMLLCRAVRINQGEPAVIFYPVKEAAQ